MVLVIVQPCATLRAARSCVATQPATIAAPRVSCSRHGCVRSHAWLVCGKFLFVVSLRRSAVLAGWLYLLGKVVFSMTLLITNNT